MLWILKFLPKNHLSFLFGQLMHIQWPPVINVFLIKKFAEIFKIDISEAEKPLAEYPSIGDFFIRKLKPDVRPLATDEVVHPCDAVITQCGRLQQGEMIQAKGKRYFLANLIGDALLAQKYGEGFYATYYLCPTDYHRVHSPVEGQIRFAIHIPGALWPVNQASVEKIPDLFSVNERIVVGIETVKGTVLVIFVGATNVGKIILSFDSDLSSNDLVHITKREHKYSQPLPIAKGQELGYFSMGSTVVMIYPKDYSQIFSAEKLQQLSGQSVKVNSKL